MKAIKELFLFGIAGAIGFVADAGVLYLLTPFIGLYAGRIISFLIAVIATWIFNRNITFSQRSAGRGLLAEFVHYLSLMVVGGAINLSVYYLLISHSMTFHQWPVAAVAVGSVAGMAANFLSSRFLLYKNHTAKH